MALEDFLEPEVAVTAVVAAAVFSPKGRSWIRRGLVYGTAGILMAGDALTSFGRSIGRGVQQAGTAAATATQNAADQAKQAAASATEATTSTTKKDSTQKSSTEQAKSPTQGAGGPA